MAEHIDNQTDWLSSGGHVWAWGRQVIARKTLGTVAVRGAYGFVTHQGQRPGRLVGKNGRPALLKATGETRAAADAAMNAYETTIDVLIQDGGSVDWEDDKGDSGSNLQITRYTRAGIRLYGNAGKTVWQYYYLDFEDMSGN